MTRSDILARLRGKIAADQPIIGGGAGCTCENTDIASSVRIVIVKKSFFISLLEKEKSPEKIPDSI